MLQQRKSGGNCAFRALLSRYYRPMKHVLAALLLGIFTTPAVADLADDVRCREISFSQSTEQRDIEAFRSFIDADARFVGNSVQRGVEAVAEAWTVFFTADGPSIKWRPQIIEVLDNGTLALSRGPYRVIAKDADGKPVENWGTFNSVWRLNDDGQWRVVFDAGSPAATAPDDATKALLDADDDCQ
jgi:ketosteroid isomerase-like protein